MTNEEAISRLHTIDGWGEREHEAIAMAIKALEQPEPCEDTIGRQATINVIKKRLFETAFNNVGIKQNVDETLLDVAENRLEIWFGELPPAQPETAKRIVGKSRDGMTLWYQCDTCNEPVDAQDNYCRGCGRRLIDEATSERLTNREVVSK